MQRGLNIWSLALILLTSVTFFPIGLSAFEYKKEIGITYCKVGEKELYLNAFYPTVTDKAVAAVIDIHGGWWMGGEPIRDIPDFLGKKGIAVFSISYRLGLEGGFPENISDCRNAVRFIRKNAGRFNINPDRIGVMGGSAGGYLSLMLSMVPEDFEDGDPASELKGISAKVNSCFSFIGPTDMLRFWYQGPDDVIKKEDGTIQYRAVNESWPNDSRPRFRILFHGITPETQEGKAFYIRMSPINYIRKDICPILICDGDIDPIVPGLHGKLLYEKLKANGNDVTYWMSVMGGHAFPSGKGFDELLSQFIDRTLISL